MTSSYMNHAESFDEDKGGSMFSPVSTTTVVPSTSEGQYPNIVTQRDACPTFSLTHEAETNLRTSQAELIGSGRDSFTRFVSRDTDSNASRPAWPPSHASIVSTEDMGGSIPLQTQLENWQRTPQMFLGYPDHRVDMTRGGCNTRWSPISIPRETRAERHQNRGVQSLSNEPTLTTEILGGQGTSGPTTSGGDHSPFTSFENLSDADELEAVALHPPVQPNNNRQRQPPRSRGGDGWRWPKQGEDWVLGDAGGRTAATTSRRREPVIQLTEEEKMAILYVLDRVQRESFNDPSAEVDCGLLTTQDWLSRVCAPVVRELELSVTYSASGLDARARLGRVESVPSLRRWVSEHWSAEKARRKHGAGIPAELRRRAFRTSAVARKNKAESQFPRTLGTRLVETVVSDASTTEGSRRASTTSSYRSLMDDADEPADPLHQTGGAGSSVDHRFLWSPVDSSVAVGLDLARGGGPACGFPRVGGGSQVPIIRRSWTCGSYDKESGNVDAGHTSGSSTTADLTSETEENDEGGDEKGAVVEGEEVHVEEVINTAEDTTHDCEAGGTLAVDRSVDHLRAKEGADASHRGPKESFGVSPIKYRERLSTTWVIPSRTSRPALVRPKSKPLTTVLTPQAGHCSSARTLPPSITVATVRVETSAATTVTGGLTATEESSPGKARTNGITRARGTTRRNANAEGASCRSRVVGQDVISTQHAHGINNGNWGACFSDSSGSSTGPMTSGSRDLHKRSAATRRSVDGHSSSSSAKGALHTFLDPAGDAICGDLGAVVSGVGDEVCLGDKGRNSDDGLLHLHECIWKSGRLIRRPDTSPVMLRIQRDKRCTMRADQ